MDNLLNLMIVVFNLAFCYWIGTQAEIKFNRRKWVWFIVSFLLSPILGLLLLYVVGKKLPETVILDKKAA